MRIICTKKHKTSRNMSINENAQVFKFNGRKQVENITHDLNTHPACRHSFKEQSLVKLYCLLSDDDLDLLVSGSSRQEKHLLFCCKYLKKCLCIQEADFYEVRVDQLCMSY